MGERQVPGCFGCNTCGYQSTLFKAICPACGAAEMVELERASRGKVLEFVPVFFPPENLKDLRQYVSVFVKLDNGCQTFGIFLGDPDKIKVGTPVVLSSFDKDSKALFFDMG